MKATLELLKGGFESASNKTPEFLYFCETFKREFTKELKHIGATKIKMRIGHFCISGYFTSPTGQIYYFSIPDVRGMEIVPTPMLMYRTATSYTDFTGGANRWIKIESGMTEKMWLC